MVLLIALLWIIVRSFLALSYLLIGKTFLNIGFTVKKWLWGSAITVTWFALELLSGMKAHAILLLLTYVLYSRFIFRQPWKKCWQGTVLLLVIGEISEVFLLLFSDFLLSAEEKAIFDNTELLTWPVLKLNTAGEGILMILALLCLLGKRLIPKLFASLLQIPLWLRLSLTVMAIIGYGTWYWNTSDQKTFGDSNGILFLSVAILSMFVLFVSIARDFSQNRLEKRNRALGATQQSISAFLFEMRAFRHDMANMLYGWQGAVMEGDIEKIRAYNAEMSVSFSLINNDNSLNLQKLTSGSVRVLLGGKLQAAELNSVPAFLYVEGVYDRFRMKDSDLCRVLGILADNAIKAASDCDCPMLHIHVFQEYGTVRFLFRNTAADSLIESMSLNAPEAKAEDDLTSAHGIGLRSAREVVSKYAGAELFVYTRGRYVEACLSLAA